jgi:hypothetical protein
MFEQQRANDPRDRIFVGEDADDIALIVTPSAINCRAAMAPRAVPE